mgnify:FL=1
MASDGSMVIETDDSFLVTQQAFYNGWVNARLGVRFVVPVVELTSPIFYSIVAGIEARLTAADIIDRVRDDGKDMPDIRAEQLRGTAERMLATLVEPSNAAPEDAVELGDDGADITESSRYRAVDGFTTATAPDPFFTRDDVW